MVATSTQGDVVASRRPRPEP